jgi:hypothetical protein
MEEIAGCDLYFAPNNTAAMNIMAGRQNLQLPMGYEPEYLIHVLVISVTYLYTHTSLSWRGG